MENSRSAKRIFLDVGANTGQTLAAVLDPELGFDQVYCFEPSTACWEKLELVAAEGMHRMIETSRRRTYVKLLQFGLWNHAGEAAIFGPGNKGASLWKKINHPKYVPTELCRFVRATDWFVENIHAGNTVFLKLNCEGAECDILDDLLDSGEFEKVSYCMVDFDVRKIASQKHREAELRARLEREGVRFPRIAFSKQVMVGATHQERIKHWLRLVENIAPSVEG